MKGPSLADRVTAADTLALEVIGLVIVLAIRLETTIFFDAALVVAIVGFASTVAFAQYIGAGGSSDDETET
jgi:multicomponent K+:H+ antiporter subunit F